MVSSIAARVKPITFGEMYSQLLSFETRLQLQGAASQNMSSVNSAARGRGGFSRGRGGRGLRGSFTSGGRGRGDQSYKPKNKFPLCQLCGRTNHPVFKYYKRFDLTYTGEEKSANAPGSYIVDSN
jgi:hypothetical protein